ncbi:hypothetical protein HN51_042740 [Arachis hypogaea]|uniref:BHLH domain-containing protein n=1 Tax=Arachis hypogaea TaxID=3818 RepID=A0A444Y8N0_ARAHY|nr:transcription factor bHLH53-like [Arachis ipaensis]XP_025673383.1 transcription factor bHLH53-like [Arachis hypogaea]QHN94887.1 Transcription factor [Arachis hypogaea]RYQ98255.1 hypothetical protein Ahy_B08g094312 [Arachis hypogaea]
MALSTYLNGDALQSSIISEIFTTKFQELTTPEELTLDHFYHQHSQEGLFSNNFFFDPYFDFNNGFFHPEILSSHQLGHSCTSSHDPFISPKPNNLFQIEYSNVNTLLSCPKRQKYFHKDEELQLSSPFKEYASPSLFDGFILNSSSLLPSEEAALAEELLLPAPVTTPSSDFMVPNVVRNGFCVGINNESQKKDSKRTISAQSIAARERRRNITEKTQELGKLVPGSSKMNTAEMLHAASKYVKYLQTQIGMLQLMNTLQKEDEVVPPSEDLCALITSPFVQEKLYSEELCFVPKDFVTTLTNQRDVRSKPTIFKDLKELIETNNVQKKA